MKNWFEPTGAEEQARAQLREGPQSKSGAALRALLLIPAVLLLALTVLAVGRDAGALHPVYTVLIAAGMLVLVMLTLLMEDKKVWFAVLFAGAVLVRAAFALGWTVRPHGSYLAGWNLALELSAAGANGWPALVGGSGVLPMDLPFVVWESLLLRLFGPYPAAVQLTNALWGGLSCLLTALLARSFTGSHRAGLAAGALLACCPTLLFSAGMLSWVPLYTFLMLTGLWLLVCRPFGCPFCNNLLAGAAWGLCQVLRPGLPVPLLGAAVWLLFTLPGRREKKALLLRTGCVLAGFLAAFLLLGLGLSALTGTNALDGHLTARAAVGLNGNSNGQYTAEDAPLLDGSADPLDAAAQRWQGPVGTLKQLARKVRFQFGSFNYPEPRMDQGGGVRTRIISLMQPALQSYALVLALLALAGSLSLFRRSGRADLLPAGLLLAFLAAAVLLEVSPAYNGPLIPLFAVCAAAPAVKLAEWTVLVAAPESKKRKAPLSPPLRAVRLAVSVAVYALMLALVLVFFTGNGAFLYEAF